ncbi:MAG TPA: hypothetical protein VE028_04140 [Nitratidesulfovibrio sp.]|nr:hypothetical protein [Nitratidesulfovibrio sp.]
MDARYAGIDLQKKPKGEPSHHRQFRAGFNTGVYDINLHGLAYAEYELERLLEADAWWEGYAYATKVHKED